VHQELRFNLDVNKTSLAPIKETGAPAALLEAAIEQNERAVDRLEIVLVDACELRNKFRSDTSPRLGYERWKGDIWIYKPYLAMLRELEKVSLQAPGALVPHHILATAGRDAYDALVDELMAKGREVPKRPSENDESFVRNAIRTLRRIYGSKDENEEEPLIYIQSNKDVRAAGGIVPKGTPGGHRLCPDDPTRPVVSMPSVTTVVVKHVTKPGV